MKRRILDIYLKRCDFWWMGYRENEGVVLNNWVPWCHSNIITAFLILEEDPVRAVEAVIKSMYSMDRFLKTYHEDGGCDEGPVYWTRAGASLLEYLELLYGASEGRIDFFDEPLVKEIGRYIRRVHINEDYYVNFADAAAKVKITGRSWFTGMGKGFAIKNLWDWVCILLNLRRI